MHDLPEDAAQPLILTIKEAVLSSILGDRIFKLKLIDCLKEKFKIRFFFHSSMDKEDGLYEVTLDVGLLTNLYPKGFGIENIVGPKVQAECLAKKIATNLWKSLEGKSDVLVNIGYSEEHTQGVGNSESLLGIDQLNHYKVSELLERE
jgi:hypothetical protein